MNKVKHEQVKQLIDFCKEVQFQFSDKIDYTHCENYCSLLCGLEEFIKEIHKFQPIDFNWLKKIVDLKKIQVEDRDGRLKKSFDTK